MKRWQRLAISFACMTGAMGSLVFEDFGCVITPWGIYGSDEIDGDDDDFFEDIEDWFNDLLD